MSKRQRKGSRGSIPVGGIARQRGKHHSLDGRDDVRSQNRRGSEGSVQDMGGKIVGRRTIKRQPAGQELVEYRSKRIDIDSLVDCSAAQLLRSHVFGRPHDFPGLGGSDTRRRGGAHLAGYAKVGKLWMSLRIQEHIARLDISMNDSAAMGRIQTIGYLKHQPGRLGWGKLAFAAPEVAQRLMQ
jgi:hypothetical protein